MEQDFLETTTVINFDLPNASKVLLVDDDDLVLQHLSSQVAAAGFEVFTVQDGQAALAALHKEFTPIVITDRNMPRMDGLALCRAIRQQSFPGYVYVMLLTVRDAEEDILAGLDAGADDYLSKRASSAQLIARLRTARRILALEHSLKTALDEKRHMAMSDALTGAHNRRYFMRHLTQELRRTSHCGGELSVLMLDIDHFKRINDQYGHSVGDEVLKNFVARIGACLPREGDWCARLGGEEFAVVLPQTDIAGAAVVAEKVRDAIASTPIVTSIGKIGVTTSIGVGGVNCPQLGQEPDVEALLNRADRCLYASKDNGRNRVTLP